MKNYTAENLIEIPRPARKVRIIKSRKGGLFLVDNIFIDKVSKNCKPSALAVYISLCRHANNDTQTCFPSRELIAKEIGSTVRTVGTAIKRLEKLEIIRVWKSKNKNGKYNNNKYTLLDLSGWEPPQKLYIVEQKRAEPKEISGKDQEQNIPHKDTKDKETNIKGVSPSDGYLKEIKEGKEKLFNHFNLNSNE